jgi:hypothetical protein
VKNPKIIQFPNPAKIFGGDRNIIAEVMTVTPQAATEWLRCNKNNRPVRKSHVAFLASEIVKGNWQVNGQAIIIAEDEQVLDGQHRLFAIIEAGIAIKTMVVYGITPEAFRTIDTGAVRTGSDALSLHFHDVGRHAVAAVATAAQWCHRLERGGVYTNSKLSNTDVITYVQTHPSLLQCAETLLSFPKESRPISVGVGTALLEMFSRKDDEAADLFMKNFYLGEGLSRNDPEYVLRQMLLRDAQKKSRYPAAIRVRMIIKAWNWLRRGNKTANVQVVSVTARDDQKIVIF